MKSILDGRPGLAAVVEQIAEVAGYFWQGFADRIILTKANKFKGYYETETALNSAHPTSEAGDYAIVNSTDTMWIWDADKEGGAGWKDDMVRLSCRMDEEDIVYGLGEQVRGINK